MLFIGNMKGLTKSSSGGKKPVEVKHIAAHDLEKKSNQHLNIQVSVGISLLCLSLVYRIVHLARPSVHLYVCLKKEKNLKPRNSSQSYGASPIIWDHTVLLVTRHK